MYRVVVLILLFFSSTICAQLHVGGNSYLYAKDRMLFVKQGVSIESNGMIYLRDNSQLLQGTTGNSTNSGNGKLSVFQEGSSDNYEYNYWCSPVGNSSPAVGNENFGITMLHMPTSVTTSDPAVILSNTASNGTALPLAIAPKWVLKFLASSSYSQWIPVFASSAIETGLGFTMKGTAGLDVTTLYGVENNSGSAQRYDFRGKPNDGNVVVGVAFNQYTLTGNPYPSAMDLSAFLTEALGCTGVAYFWEQDKTVNSHLLTSYRGGYGTFSPISRGGLGIYVPAPFYGYDVNGDQLALESLPLNFYSRYFSPIGQGFMIEGSFLATNVTIKNDYRVYQKENFLTSTFERNAESAQTETDFLDDVQSVSGFDYSTVSTQTVPQIRFNAMLNNEGFRQFVVGFDDSATDGADHGMDAKSPNLNLPADIFIAMDAKEYVISVIDFDINKRIPLGLKNTAAANFKLTVGEMQNFSTENVFVHDMVADTYFDIKNGIFEVTMPPGVNVDRYEITFTDTALGNPTHNNQNFEIENYNETQTLTILNPTAVMLKSATLYDVTGKLIFTKEINNATSYEFSTVSLSEGIYVVKVISSNGVETAKKILVTRF